MDMVAPPFEPVPPAEIEQAAMDVAPGQELRLRIDGLNAVGEPIQFTALLPVAEGETGADRLFNSGLELIQNGDQVIIDNVTFDSPAQSAGLDWDQTITDVRRPVPQPSKYWMFIPALLVLAGIVWMQRRRAGTEPRPEAEGAPAE
jgi:predicted metalloprotease with PDZ domain